MGRPLFALEDNFIASMCMGSSDQDTLEEVAQALEAGRQQLEATVQNKVRRSRWSERRDEFHVVLQNGMFVIAPPAELEADVLAAEYGDLDNAPRPMLRQAVLQERTNMQRRISKNLDLR